MPHGGYHGTVKIGADKIDGQANPNQQTIQEGYKDDQGIYQIKGGIGTDSFENIQNQDQGLAAQGSEFRENIMDAQKMSDQAGINALTEIKNNPEMARAGLTSNEYANFMREMTDRNPEGMGEVFPFSSGNITNAISGPLSSVITGNPMGIIGSFIKDTLQNKFGVKQMGHGGVMSMADPAIAITINMGPGLPVNMQEIKEQKMAYNKNKMAEGMSGQRNMDAVDLAPDLTRGI